jgi:hypothetical protein
MFRKYLSALIISVMLLLAFGAPLVTRSQDPPPGSPLKVSTTDGSTHFNGITELSFPPGTVTINGRKATINTTAAPGTATVRSVGLSLPPIFSVTGSPVTTSGTLTATLASQSPNLFFASPDGSSGAPTFRAMLAADVPTLDASKIGSGAFPPARLPSMVASGSSHAPGIVPDPPSSSGTAKYLREDATWNVPPGSLVVSVFGRTGAVAAATNDYNWAQIDKTASSLADLTTRSASDLSSGSLAKARQHSATVYNDQTNTFGAFVQTFQGGANHLIADPSDTTKKFQFDVSNVAPSTTRTLNIPNANSTAAQSISAVPHFFLTAMSAQGTFTASQPACGDLSDAGVFCNGTSAASLTGSLSLLRLALTSGHYFVGNASNNPADVAMSGDCALANTGAVTCTKTSGTVFSYFATGTDASNLTGSLSDSRLSSNVVLIGRANTYSSGFLQSFFVGSSNLEFKDPTTSSKKFTFDASNISASTTRTVNIPDANSTTAQAKTAVSHFFFTAMSAQGVFTTSQPACADLSDSSTGCSTTVGTIATQAANSVSITGGSISGASVSGTAVQSTTPVNGITAGVAQYKSGSWTPSPTGLTISSSGTGTYTGTYSRTGNDVTIYLYVSSTTTTAATAGTTFFSGLPYTVADYGICSGARDDGAAAIGNNFVSTSNVAFMPAWSATSQRVVLRCGYRTTDNF